MVIVEIQCTLRFKRIISKSLKVKLRCSCCTKTMKKCTENGKETPHIMDLRTTDTRIAEFSIWRPFIQRQNIQEMLSLLTTCGSHGEENISFIIQ